MLRRRAALSALIAVVAGAVLLSTQGTAQAGLMCMTNHHGYWAWVELQLGQECTGENDRGSVRAVSDIPADEAKPSVLPVWDNASGRYTHLFSYQEDKLPFAVNPTASRRSPLSQRPEDGSVVGSATHRVIYQPSANHRASVAGGECYREWRDRDGNWRRSASYGSEGEACRRAAWNAYRRSAEFYLYDRLSPTRFPSQDPPPEEAVLPGEAGNPNAARASGALVSNTGQTYRFSGPGGEYGGGFQYDAAQAFTTGNHAGGYTLTSVDLSIRQTGGTQPGYSVSIHEDAAGDVSLGQSRVPGTSLGTLTNPGSLPTGPFDPADPNLIWEDQPLSRFRSWTGGIALSANTTYWIVLDVSSGATNAGMRFATTTSEDSAQGTGWSISDLGLYQDYNAPAGSGSWAQDSSVLYLAVNGSEN